MTLIQNQGQRIFELSIGVIAPKDVVNVPEDKLKKVLSEGCGELVVLEVAKAKVEKSLDELKAEADELGIDYRPNIGASTLAKKIEVFKAEHK